jgi:hypothetical protein
MTRIRSLFVAAIVAAAIAAFPGVALAQANVPNYTDQGGATTHIGGTLQIETGGAFKSNGVSAKPALGQATTASASDTVVTGLSKVTACVANLDSAPTADPETATCSIGDQNGSPAAGSILVQTWKTLGGTPAAATTFSKKVNWIAIGS